MRNDREQANILRKSGLSYSEIMSRMKVPRSTLSSWFRDQEWSKDIAIETIKKSKTAGAIRLVVLNSIRGNRLKKIYEEAGQDASVDFDELKYHPLFIAGIMSYWAHGDKTSRSLVSLSSSDANIVKIWGLFMQNICGVAKIRISMKRGVCIVQSNSAYLKRKILKWIELLAAEIGEEKYLAGIV